MPSCFVRQIYFRFNDIAGKICEILIPINLSIIEGHGERISICTLSDLSLLRKLATNFEVLSKIKILGRLLSENKGIDSIIRFTTRNPSLRYIIICGKDTKGHYPGDSLKSLSKYGVDNNNRIIGSISPNPVLLSNISEIEHFRNQVKIIDMIGENNTNIILQKLNELHLMDIDN